MGFVVTRRESVSAAPAANASCLMDPGSQWVVLARVLRPQGRKGEVLADLFTDFPERFTRHPHAWLAPAGFAERSVAEPEGVSTLQAVEIAAHWLPVGRNAGRIVLHFAGVDTIQQAEPLAGMEVVAPLGQRMPLESDAAYISDLIGCTVYDHGLALGTIDGVEFPTTPDGSRRLEEAAPLLTLRTSGGEEVLIPYARAYLLEMDVAAKVIRMQLPEGLAEINKPSAEP